MSIHQSIPPPEWEPSMHLILAAGIVVMILVSILTAYMEAMHYLRLQNTMQTAASGHTAGAKGASHHAAASSTANGATNSNNTNTNYKYYERTNCSNHAIDTCNKDRGSGSGHGAATISASISSQQQQQSCPLPFNALPNGKNKNSTSTTNNHNNSNSNSSSSNHNNNNNQSGAGKQTASQKRRKNSSATNSEKVPTNNKLSSSSTISDKKSSSSSSSSSSPYAPIFQNLTNVIASPPPPLPTFDNEFDSIEYKKLRSKRSAKKLNSLNGSIASSSDDIGVPSCSYVSQSHTNSGGSNQMNKAKSNGKVNGLKINGSNSVNGERENSDLQAQTDQSNPQNHHRKGNLKDALHARTSTSDEDISPLDNIELYNDAKVDRSQQEQPTVLPIQPPSSLTSTPSSSSFTASTSSSSSSSSSSPPLSASSYGEYSLLGPGATFELPCLRVRSAQI